MVNHYRYDIPKKRINPNFGFAPPLFCCNPYLNSGESKIGRIVQMVDESSWRRDDHIWRRAQRRLLRFHVQTTCKNKDYENFWRQHISSN